MLGRWLSVGFRYGYLGPRQARSIHSLIGSPAAFDTLSSRRRFCYTCTLKSHTRHRRTGTQTEETDTHTHTHTHTHSHTHTHTHKPLKRTHAHTPARTHTHTHTHIRARTRTTHTYARTHTHTHTHTRAHTQLQLTLQKSSASLPPQQTCTGDYHSSAYPQAWQGFEPLTLSTQTRRTTAVTPDSSHARHVIC